MKVDGNRIKNLMKANKMTQQQLADRCGINRAVISYVINGKRGTTPKIIQRIANVFHVFPESLTFGKHVAPDKDKVVAGIMAIMQADQRCPCGNCDVCPYIDTDRCYPKLRQDVIELFKGLGLTE